MILSAVAIGLIFLAGLTAALVVLLFYVRFVVVPVMEWFSRNFSWR